MTIEEAFRLADGWADGVDVSLPSDTAAAAP
jgi:hypothetical protein